MCIRNALVQKRKTARRAGTQAHREVTGGRGRPTKTRSSWAPQPGDADLLPRSTEAAGGAGADAVGGGIVVLAPVGLAAGAADEIGADPAGAAGAATGARPSAGPLLRSAEAASNAGAGSASASVAPLAPDCLAAGAADKAGADPAGADGASGAAAGPVVALPCDCWTR